jgi:hypothetical protein
MMSAPWLAPALTGSLLIRRSAARLQPLAWALDGQRRFISRAGDRDLTVILLAFLRGGRRSGFARVVALPSKFRSWPAGALCGPRDFRRPSSALTFSVRTSTGEP